MSTLKKWALWVMATAFIGVGISYSKLYLYHIVAFAFAVAAGIYMVRNTSRHEVKPLLKDALRPDFRSFFLLMFLWYAVSLIWCSNVTFGLYYLFYLANGLFILFTFRYAINQRDDLFGVVKAVGGVLLFEMLLSLFEGFTGIQWPISPYSDSIVFFRRGIGYDPGLPKDVIDAIRHTPTGFRWNPNDLATTMLLVLPFFIFLRRNIIRIPAAAGAVCIILLTGSRGALIGLVLMLLALIILFLRRKYVFILLGAAVVAVFGFWLSMPAIERNYPVKYREISTTAMALNNFLFTDHEQVNDSSSVTIRQNLLSNGIHALKQSNGLGVGAGNSTAVQMAAQNTHGVYSMHNFWAEILVDAGVVFFLLWSVWYFLFIRRLYLIYRHTKSDWLRYLARSCTLSLIVFVVGMLAMSTAVYFFPMWILFGCGMAVIDLERKSMLNT